MTLIVDVIEAPSGAPVELTGQAAARTWGTINTSGTVSISDSLNLSSVVDNDTGDYQVNFSNSFSDVNYGISCGTLLSTYADEYSSFQDKLVSQIRVRSLRANNNTGTDPNEVGISFHGDLA